MANPVSLACSWRLALARLVARRQGQASTDGALARMATDEFPVGMGTARGEKK